jgi:hypothetical protein
MREWERERKKFREGDGKEREWWRERERCPCIAKFD